MFSGATLAELSHIECSVSVSLAMFSSQAAGSRYFNFWPVNRSKLPRIWPVVRAMTFQFNLDPGGVLSQSTLRRPSI
jgi:hypothetical protein